jgi:folate-binding protein YgfZ
MLAGYAEARDNAAVFDLSGRGLVEVSGKDAVSFLHNLCTNDIKGLPLGAGCEAFFCTAKARVIAHVFVSRLEVGGREVLWLDMVPGLAGKVLRHLDHYHISEEVELADRSAELSQMHLCGPHARQVWERMLIRLPEHADVVGPLGVFLIGRDYLGLPGYDLFWARDRAAEARRLLTTAGAAAADADTYEVLRVEAGLPAYGVDITEDRLVMEVGRTRQAISFTKGCYLGQEPVVMARDRGHANRTLLGLRLGDGDPVPAGTRVLQGEDEVGQVTSSLRSPRLLSIALAYLRRGSQAPGTRVEVAAEGGRRPAEVADLPFAHPQSA